MAHNDTELQMLLKKEVVEIAEKWHPTCEMLKNHNLTHE